MMETINLECKAFLEDQSNYRLNEISKIKDYFNEEIKYQLFLTKKLSKYLTVFGYFNKILTVALTVFSGSNIFRSNHFCIFLVILFVVWSNYKITTRNNVKKEET